jgi:dTDP-4-dehydrorhamnose 3,5-epimerase-like enzyme
MQIIKYAFQQHGDERGMLVALEELGDIPFEIKRVYYMYDTKEGVRRGFHAHRHLEQILICIHGSCKVLLDNGEEKKIVSLEKPYEGLYVPNNMWREMYDFSPDAVLMVLASDIYKEEDYIRDYDVFLKMIGEEKKNDSVSESGQDTHSDPERVGPRVWERDGAPVVYRWKGRRTV